MNIVDMDFEEHETNVSEEEDIEQPEMSSIVGNPRLKIKRDVNEIKMGVTRLFSLGATK